MPHSHPLCGIIQPYIPDPNPEDDAVIDMLPQFLPDIKVWKDSDGKLSIWHFILWPRNFTSLEFASSIKNHCKYQFFNIIRRKDLICDFLPAISLLTICGYHDLTLYVSDGSHVASLQALVCSVLSNLRFGYQIIWFFFVL